MVAFLRKSGENREFTAILFARETKICRKHTSVAFLKLRRRLGPQEHTSE